MNDAFGKSARVSTAFRALSILSLASLHSLAGANPIAASLCSMLKEQIPQIRTYTPEVARAHLNTTT